MDLSIEKEESPFDFKKNINLITAFCAKKDIPVLMIKSHANKNFLPGLGKGNFLFYKYLGVDDKINPLKIEDNRFINAYINHSNKNFKKALEEYKVILNNPLSIIWVENIHWFYSIIMQLQKQKRENLKKQKNY